ncbi:LysR family transcriptional regulator [Candidatus Njordibacter sp. Uisw_039]|jgi:DNA-binding transcriptional LysR family regulator|uniref:LysR family transcriptional regulator n=1 Tax=Candidatus Njordibacter sp. Uisw_039 TaxID=3230972 RepID=UPI003A15D76B
MVSFQISIYSIPISLSDVYMNLRFRQLQALHKVVESGTVSAAAEQLNISQPGVSNLLSQLEHTCQLKLFNRLKGKLIPTNEGLVLYNEVDTLVRGLAHVEQSVVDLQNKQTSKLQIASIHALSFGFMQAQIAQFSRQYENLSVSFQSQYSQKIQEWVDVGLFEIGVSEMPVATGPFNTVVFKIETLCAMPSDHPLACHKVLTPSLLSGEPLIIMGPQHMVTRRAKEAFVEAGARWNPVVHTHLFANKLSFIKEGMGIGLVDVISLRNDSSDRFITRPFAPNINLDVAIITSKSRPVSDTGQAFLGQLESHLWASCKSIKVRE